MCIVDGKKQLCALLDSVFMLINLHLNYPASKWYDDIKHYALINLTQYNLYIKTFMKILDGVFA